MALVNRSEIETKTRFYLGDVDSSTLSSATIQMVIADAIAIYTDDDTYNCEILYYTVIECLQYLIRKEAANKGNEIEREEQNAKRRVKVKYSSSASAWEGLLSDYRKDAGLICASLVDPNKQGSVIIGGVSQKEYDRVNNNPDSRNALSPSGRSIRTNRRY